MLINYDITLYQIYLIIYTIYGIHFNKLWNNFVSNMV